MGYTYYSRLILIPADHELTWERWLELLREKYGTSSYVTVEQPTPQKMRLSTSSCALNIYWEDAPHVVLESQEMASGLRDEADRIAVETCYRRITTSGDPDPNLRCMEIHGEVMDMFESIPGLYIMDSAVGKLTKTSGSISDRYL